MSNRPITRAALAKLFKCSLRTIDRHGLARGKLLNRTEAAARLGISPSTFDKRRTEPGFPEPVKPLGYPQWDALVLDRWKESLKTQMELAFDPTTKQSE